MVYSSEEVFTSTSGLLPSGLPPSGCFRLKPNRPWTKADHQLIMHHLAIFTNVASLARPVDLSLWKKIWIKVAVKVNKRDVKENKVPLGDNRGAT